MGDERVFVFLVSEIRGVLKPLPSAYTFACKAGVEPAEFRKNEVTEYCCVISFIIVPAGFEPATSA